MKRRGVCRVECMITSDLHADARRRWRSVAIAMFLIGIAVHALAMCSQSGAEDRRVAPAVTAQRSEFFAALCAWRRSDEAAAAPFAVLSNPQWLSGLCDGDPAANARAYVHDAACVPVGE